MKIVLKLAEPKTEREQLFRVETQVDDWKNPGEGWVVLDGKEYLVEVHFDQMAFDFVPKPGPNHSQGKH